MFLFFLNRRDKCSDLPPRGILSLPQHPRPPSRTMSASALRRQGPRSFQSVTSSIAPDKQPPPKTTKPPSLARRLLFPYLHPDTDLPPLLVSPAASPELNDELYNFIAIALRAYVHPWWTKITRYDKEFLPDITRVVTVVVRSLEARVVRTDLSPLVLRDLPALLSQHFQDYRNVQTKLHTSYAAGGAATLPQLFHQAQPHMAVSADGMVDEAYVRQAMDDILKTCLPTEDYEADPERYIIREILVKVVLGGVVPRLTQPWFIHQCLLTLLGPEEGQEKVVVVRDSIHTFSSCVHKPLQEFIHWPSSTTFSCVIKPILMRHQPPAPLQDTDAPVAPPQRTGSSFSFQALVIVFLSALRSFSGACLACMHAYRHTIDAIKKANQSGSPLTKSVGTDSAKDQASNTLPGTLVPMTPMPPTASIAQPAPPLSPPPSPPSLSRASSTRSTVHFAPSVLSVPLAPVNSLQPEPQAQLQAQLNYVHPTLQLLSTLLTATSPPASPPRNTPLAITHVLALLLTPFTSLISRLLPYLLYTHLLSPPSLISILQAAKAALFPGGWPVVPPPDPTPDEQTALRASLVRRLLSLFPTPLLPVLGTSPAARAHAADALLEPLSSPECNAHLVVFLLDVIILTIFPEMGVAVSRPTADGEAGDGVRTPVGSVEGVHTVGTLTPPRPDSRPP